MLFDSRSYHKHFYNPTANLVMPKKIPTKESKSEIETHPLTSEAKVHSRHTI